MGFGEENVEEIMDFYHSCFGRLVEQVREEFLAGIQSDDFNRLGSVLSALYENAGRLREGRALSRLPRSTKRE